MGINLIIFASIIFMLLGCGHIFLTLCTNLLEPKDDELLSLNKASYSRITDQTTLWNGGVGFHISHSIGLLFFGLFYLALSIDNAELITSSAIFSILIILIPLVYLFLSIKYWFIAPTVSIGLACFCYVLGLLMLN